MSKQVNGTHAAPVRNAMSHANMFKLCTWLQANAEEQRKVSASKAAEIASKAIGLQVTERHIMKARQYTGVPVDKPRRAKTAKTQAHHDRLRVIAVEIMRVMEGLGLEPSKGLREISRGQKLSATGVSH